MKCLILDYVATINDQMYTGVVFLDNSGIPTDEQNLALGAFTLSALTDLATAVQNSILAYSSSQGYGLIAADILNLPSTGVGIT